MNVYTNVNADSTEVTIQLKSRDDLEKLIEWVPRLRPLFPYPEPPSDPAPGENVDMGSAAPETRTLPCAGNEQGVNYEAIASATTPPCLCQGMTINQPMGIPCPDCGRPL